MSYSEKRKKQFLTSPTCKKTLSQFSSVPTLQFWIVTFNSTDLAGYTNPPCNLSKALQKVLRENNVDHLTSHFQHKAIGHCFFLVFYPKYIPWESNLSLSTTWLEINGCLEVPDNPRYQWGTTQSAEALIPKEK